jgi:hypothetical protein
MINTIRNTVLAIVSKDNRGYITPEEFNLFARQTQLDLFGQYMYDYSNAINKQNARMHNSGYSDVPELLHEIIDKFLVEDVLVYNSTSDKFYVPGDNPAQPSQGKSYKIIRLTYNNAVEIEKVSPVKALNLLSSSMVAPTDTYPVYVLNEYATGGDIQGIQVYPVTITSNVTINYLRYPLDPKWTYYTLLSDGAPVFNQSASDFQDFELPYTDAPRLVVGICKLAGVSIQEADVVQLMQAEEVNDNQQKS